MNAFAPHLANLEARRRRNQARALAGNHGRAPVRRRSPGDLAAAGHCRPMSAEARRDLVKIVDAYNEAHRGPGGRSPMTPAAMKVLRTLVFQLMDRTTGQLDPALTYIAQAANRCYQSVNSAIRQLEGLEVLKIQRRSRPGDDGAPSWVQDTNLYLVQLPARIRAWWERHQEARQAAQRRRLEERGPADALGAQEAAAAAREGYQAEDERQAAERRQKADDAALLKALSQQFHGPGAAAHRAQLEKLAQERGLAPPPESNS